MMNNKLLKTAAKVAFLIGAVGLAGCAYVPDHIHNHYRAPISMTKVRGAKNVTVTVAVQNHKKRHDEVSRTDSGLGIAFAGVYMKIDKTFKAAIESALENRGFHAGNEGVAVNVIVEHFYLPEEMGFVDISHKGHLEMVVTIPSVGYKQRVAIAHFHKTADFFGFTPGRTAAANALMAQGINQVVNNPEFIAALLKAGHAGAVVPRLSAAE